MGFWIGENGYYVGDQQNPNDIAVPERPSFYYIWSGSEWVLDLPRIQGVKWSGIKAERVRRSQYGRFKVTIDLVDHWVSSESDSKMNILLYLSAGSGLPSGLEHPTMDNGAIEMTPQIAEDMRDALLENESDLYAAMNAHKVAMMALPDPSNYSFSSGWPATFSSI